MSAPKNHERKALARANDKAAANNSEVIGNLRSYKLEHKTWTIAGYALESELLLSAIRIVDH